MHNNSRMMRSALIFFQAGFQAHRTTVVHVRCQPSSDDTGASSFRWQISRFDYCGPCARQFVQRIDFSTTEICLRKVRTLHFSYLAAAQ